MQGQEPSHQQHAEQAADDEATGPKPVALATFWGRAEEEGAQHGSPLWAAAGGYSDVEGSASAADAWRTHDGLAPGI